MSIFSKNPDILYKRRRNALVEQIREKGIKDDDVLRAINAVPRHLFVDTALQTRAYEDSALPIMLRQTISQPYTVARQSELLEIKKGDKILEVGTGSGYQSAVLMEMGAKVYTIERHQPLYEHTRKLMWNLGYRPEFKLGDGTLGWTAYAPYNGIVVTAGAPVVPQDLKLQLAVGGKLIIPVGDDEKQRMLRIIRTSDDEFIEEDHDEFKFVPLIGKSGW